MTIIRYLFCDKFRTIFLTKPKHCECVYYCRHKILESNINLMTNKKSDSDTKYYNSDNREGRVIINPITHEPLFLPKKQVDVKYSREMCQKQVDFINNLSKNKCESNTENI